MRVAFQSLCLSLVVLGLAAPALGQATTMSLIDLTTKTVTPFPVCAGPSAVAWVPAASPGGGGGTCTCDEDRDHDKDREHGKDRDKDRHARRGKSVRGGEHRDGKHRDRDDDGKHHDRDDDDECECEHEDEDDDCGGGGAGGGGGGRAVSNTAYMLCDEGQSMMRIDLTTSPPVATLAAVLIEGSPSSLSIDATGTRALVAGDMPRGTFSYFDLTPVTAVPAAPAKELGPIVLPLLGIEGEIADISFYGAGKAVAIVADAVYVVDLTTTPPGDPTRTVVIPLRSPAISIAVDTARNRAAVGLDLGGVQVVDLVTNTLVGPELGDSGDTLGIAIAPSGSPAITVYETRGNSQVTGFPYAMVVALGATPSVTNLVDLSGMPTAAGFSPAPSGVTFNPITNDALVVGDFGVGILKPPYTTLDPANIITYPAGYDGTTKHGIATDGTRVLVVNEDHPLAPTPVAPVVKPAAVTRTSSIGHDKCHEHHDRDHERKEHGRDD
jgi:hypothetical protein